MNIIIERNPGEPGRAVAEEVKRRIEAAVPGANVVIVTPSGPNRWPRSEAEAA